MAVPSLIAFNTDINGYEGSRGVGTVLENGAEVDGRP